MLQDDKKSKSAGVYMLTCLVNSKIYFGKTNNFKERARKYKNCKHKNKINYAIRKYGWHNFRMDIIKEFNICQQKEMLDFESKLILEFKTTNNKIGYNILLYSNDTTGFKHSKKSIEKMSGKNNHSYNNSTYNSIKVCQLDKNNNIIKVWDSARKASLALTGKVTGGKRILQVCNKKEITLSSGYKIIRKTTMGYSWRFPQDISENSPLSSVK